MKEIAMRTAPQFGNRALGPHRSAKVPKRAKAPAKPQKPSIAYRAVADEMYGGRQVHLSPEGVKGYFCRKTNAFVPLPVEGPSALKQLREAGKFRRPGS